MPSQTEMQQLRDQHTGLQLWSAMPADLTNPPMLGEVVVVEFDDVVKALAKVRADTLDKALEALMRQCDQLHVAGRISTMGQAAIEATINALRGES